MEAPESRIVGTMLSGKPREESVPVALLVGMAITLASLLCWRDPHLAGLLSASGQQVVTRHEFWRLLTATGVHADFGHLAANVPLVVFFGFLLYGYFGFWIYPVAMLLLGAVATLLSLLTYPAEVALIGASGLVYLMLGFWLALYALIQRTLPVGKRLVRVAGIALIVLVPTTLQPEVSYRTHFIACGLGIAAGIVYFWCRKGTIRSLESVESEPPPEWS